MSYFSYPAVLIAMGILTIPTILYDIMHIQRSRTARYFVLTLMVLMSGLPYTILSYHVIIMLVFPIVVACIYCDRGSVLYTSILNVPVMIVSHLIAFHLKIVPDEPLVTLRGVIVYGLIPRIIEMIAFSVICLSVTGKLQRLITNLVEKNNELYDNQQTLISSLAELVEAQSHETGEHVKRVAAYTKILCHALGFSDESMWIMDITCCRIRPEKSCRLQRKLPVSIMSDMMERDMDISKRCYKEAWTPEQAREEIVAQGGQQFDPKLTALFDSHFEEFLEVLEQYPDQ